MATFTIDIADKALPALKTHMHRYNADTGADLTLDQWLNLHVRELAVADAVTALVPAIQAAAEAAAKTAQEQAEADANAQLRAARVALMADLDKP